MLVNFIPPDNPVKVTVSLASQIWVPKSAGSKCTLSLNCTSSKSHSSNSVVLIRPMSLIASEKESELAEVTK